MIAKSKTASNDASSASIDAASPTDSFNLFEGIAANRALALSIIALSMSKAWTCSALNLSKRISMPIPRPQPTSSTFPPSTVPPSLSIKGASKYRWRNALGLLLIIVCSIKLGFTGKFHLLQIRRKGPCDPDLQLQGPQQLSLPQPKLRLPNSIHMFFHLRIISVAEQ